MKALIAIGVLGSIAAWSVSMIEGTNHSWLALAIPTGILAIYLVFCYFGSVWSHLEDLANLASRNQKITAAENRLESVRSLAADKHGLPDTLLALNQEDNPVTQYMNIVASAIRNVEDENGYKASVEGRIASRAAGPFSLVVTVFGSSVTI